MGFLGWLAGPWGLIITTVSVVAVLLRRQFASNARTAVMASLQGLAAQENGQVAERRPKPARRTPSHNRCRPFRSGTPAFRQRFPRRGFPGRGPWQDRQCARRD
ncbi:hypothetical protein V6L77_21460 [Pannonibacter sp. Pt2-lr]